jgi:hypothetical protein
MAKSITADVAIKTSVLRLNAARVIPLIAPPVPNIPAINPDKAPPIIEFVLVGASTIFLLIINTKLVATKNTPRQISRIFVSRNLLRYAPAMTNKFFVDTFSEKRNFGDVAGHMEQRRDAQHRMKVEKIAGYGYKEQ